eukprot:jgi/Botrbrau1/13359/Bobra.0158s0012.1
MEPFSEAWALFHDRDYVQAWTLFKEAHSGNPEDTKALYGLGMSLKKLQCFASAAQYFAQGPSDEAFKAALRTALELEQQSQGIFENDALCLLSDYKDSEFADFVGPVTFATHPDGGWGLQVSENVAAGDLLFAANPAAVISVTLPCCFSIVGIIWRPREEYGVQDLVRVLFGLSRKSKLDLRRLRCLFDGTEETARNVPDMDWFRHPATEEELLASLTDITDASTPEILHLERICRHNAWIRRKTGPTGDRRHLKWFQQDVLNGSSTNGRLDGLFEIGIWYLPGACDHSCQPTAHIVDVQNVLFVRASRELQAGALTRLNFSQRQPLVQA